MKVYVKCTFIIPVEVSDDWTPEDIHFQIEENSCPGTGLVGAALTEIIETNEQQSTCWACNHGGKNELVEDPAILGK